MLPVTMATFQLAENAVELDQLRQERMALQLKLQSSKAEVDTLKKRLEVVAQFREVHVRLVCSFDAYAHLHTHAHALSLTHTHTHTRLCACL